MPYNTRRKSLSLPSLGIQLPQSSRARKHSVSASSASPAALPAAFASTSASASASVDATSSSSVRLRRPDDPPAKKIKRSHSPPAHLLDSNSLQSLSISTAMRDHTPPLSPRRATVDLDGINDDVVAGAIRLLEQTGNRPLLIKDLTANLINSLQVVESSANPHAIVSSRLNSYIKRPWTALSPCPLGKELVVTHPRRIYFFLNTQPRQPIPEPVSPVSTRSIITPSLTSDDDDRKHARSPSPDIDLYHADLLVRDDEIPLTPGESFSNRSTHPNTPAPYTTRAMSPPLERDEKEFTATASSLLRQQAKRQRSKSMPMPIKSTKKLGLETDADSEETTTLLHPSAELYSNQLLSSSPISSPFMRPLSRANTLGSALKRRIDDLDLPLPLSSDVKRPKSELFEPWLSLNVDFDLHSLSSSDIMRSPENVPLDELEGWLGNF